MHKINQFISFSLLLGAIAIAGPAYAQETDIPENGRRPHARRHFQQLPEGVRDQLLACREKDTHEDRRECAKAVFEDHDIEHPKRFARRGRRMHRVYTNGSDELKEAMRECWNKDTREDKVACIRKLREKHGGGHHGIRPKLKRIFNALPEESKQEMRECRTDHQGDREAMISCFRSVYQKYLGDSDE